MKTLTGIRATGRQRLQTSISNGDFIEIVLYYLTASQQWKMDITYQDFQLNGQRVYNGLNLLCQYEAIIPFGIAVEVSDGGEPFLINDFISGRVRMSVLTPEEVTQVQNFYISQRND